MSVKTNEEVEKLKVIGQIVRKTLEAISDAC
jgi:methionine aminopeptidase